MRNLFIVFLLGFSSLVYGYNLPDLGSPTNRTLSPEDEREMGRQFLQQILRSERVMQDPIINHYIDGLGQKLVQHSDEPQREFRFIVIENAQINAFAGPNAYIGINTGTILAAQSPGELASVMAHEISHVTQHHLARTLAKIRQVQLPSLGALLGGIILGGPAGAGIINGALGGGSQVMIDTIRAHEQEADRIGMNTLAKAGFNPEDMSQFFERLQNQHRFDESTLPEFLRTHPFTVSRIADTQARISPSNPSKTTGEQISFALVQARVQVLMKPFIKPPLGSDLKSRYCLAMYYLQQRNAHAAADTFKQLMEEYPDNTILQLSYAQASPSSLKELYDKNKKNKLISSYYCEALTEKALWSEAQKCLEQAIAASPQNPTLYELQAKTLSKLQHMSKAYLLLAQAEMLKGNYPRAAVLLEQGLKQEDLDPETKRLIEKKLILVK